MKKKLFFLPMVAIIMAACSSNETIEVNENKGDLISFHPIVKGVTRAADADLTSDATSFNVEAFNTGTTTSPYFSNVTFTNTSRTFTSATKYYWPTNNLDFYAYSPISSSQFAKTDYKTFTITPSNTVSEQVDFIYANTKNKGKGTSGEVTTLNFRHAGAKIAVKVKNSAPNLKFEISGWKLGYLDNTATFTYGDASTDTDTPNAQLAFSDWSENSTQSADNTYSTTFTANAIAAESTAYFLEKNGTPSTTDTDEDLNMILIPQTLTAATAYASTTAGAKPNGSYIALKMVIENNTTAGETVAAATADGKWAMWPIGGYNWEPGKKYTYTIDLAGGGYYETNQDSDTDLDPILEGAEIKFATVTVDGWTDRAVNIPPPTNLTELRTLATGGGDCSEYIGWVITSDGCIYPNATAAGEKTKVAMIAYAGLAGSTDTSTGSESYCGLAIALTDAENNLSAYFGPEGTDESLTNYNSYDPVNAMTDKEGDANTAALLSAHPEGTTYFAYKANNYSVVRPSNTSTWFVPSFGQWILFFNNFGADITSSNIESKMYYPLNSEVRAKISTALTNAGGSIIQPTVYGSSTEANENNFYDVSFATAGNSTSSNGKVNANNVRTFFAF